MADELSYYRGRLDELTGQVIRSDSLVSRARRELGQRKKAMAILSELQFKVRVDTPETEMIREALKATAAGLKMDRSAFLHRESTGLRVTAATGYPAVEDPIGKSIAEVPQARLVTTATPVDATIESLHAVLKVPFFVTVPVTAGGREVGFIVSGRLREQKPFYPALDEGDFSTWQATAGFLGAALHNGELFRKTQALATSFARFVPAEFLELLGKSSVLDITLGDSRSMEMTILFSDIRGFTSISEKLSPEATFNFVNGYLKHAAPIIQAHGGFIDKYIGDAIMALFPGDNGPLGAIRAGIGLREAVTAYNAESGLPPIAAGVGIHTGHVILGTTGFQNRLDCTVIADAVNLASRLEGLTKYYGSALITSGETWQKLPAESYPAARLVDRVKVKGKSEPVALYDVFEAEGEAGRSAKLQSAESFAVALAAYTAGDFAAANTALEKLASENPADLAVKLLQQRIANIKKNGLPLNWTGVTALDAK